MGQWVVSVRRYEPPSESGIHSGRFPVPQVYGGYMTGRSAVHGRHIDRLCRIQSLTGDIGTPCGTTPPLPQRGCARLPSQRQRWTLGQRLNSSLDAMGMVPIRQPAPAAGTNKASPPPSASRTAKNGTGRPGCPAHQSDEQSGARITGQNGRRSAKRAIIRTARSARTLSSIRP